MSYLPGYGEAATRMLAARSAEERLGFLPASLVGGARVLDVGCGPGALTAGLARWVGPAGTLVGLDAAAEHLASARAALRGAPCRWVVARGAVPALPLPDRGVDVVVAHALVEHLADPVGALAAMRRVLAPGGTLAVVTSDWSGARVEDPDAAATVAAYRRVRAAAGGHPDAGARLAAWVRDAGLDVVHEAAHHRRDMTGPDLAAYLVERVPGAAAARRWAAQESPVAVDQRWVELLAHRSGRA